MGFPKPAPRPALDRAPEWRKIMDFYTWLKPGLWLMRLPWIGPYLSKKKILPGRDANFFVPQVPASPTAVRIAVGEAPPRGHQAVLPGLVVERLLREADGIFVMAACPCRTAFHCKNHSREIGCLHIGPAAKGISTRLGRHLTTEEGIAYLEAAVADGLIPTILYNPGEAEIFGVDKTRMLSICLCCECCCDVRLMLRSGPDRYWDLFNHRMPGIRMVVGDTCTHCGACVQACYGGEKVISLAGAKAEIGERCIGCGKCVAACPSEAISVEFDPQVDWMQSLLERISTHTRINS